MYWQDKYRTSADAAKALQLAARGKIHLTPSELHVAHVAVRSGLSGLSENPMNLAGLDGGFKSLLKAAKKLSPSHALAKAIAPKLYKKIEKIEPAGLLHIKTSSPKTAPALVSQAPATVVLAEAPPQPIPQLPSPMSQDPYSFAQGSGGGGGSAPSAGPLPADAPAGDDSGLSMPVIIGIGAGALLLLYLFMRKRR